MAAEGTDVVRGGSVGGRLAKDSLRQSKCPDAIPSRRRGSSLSREAERRAYQWCREYLGGAWRRVRPEELRVDPVRWEVRGHPLRGPGREGRAGAGNPRQTETPVCSAAGASVICSSAARCRTICPA